MKKIFLTIALLASIEAAFAQTEVKSPQAAKAAVEKAEADIANPKKNTKMATWFKYGQTLLDAYNTSVGAAWRGASHQEADMVQNNLKPMKTESVTLNGTTYSKEVYPLRNLYFSADGKLAIIEVTEEVVPSALDKAVESFVKAASLDEKGSKTKELQTALNDISLKCHEEAVAAYNLGKKDLSSVWFEKAASSAAANPLNYVDSLSIYNAGLTALECGNMERAKSFYNKAFDIKYYAKGDTYAKLGAIALVQKDTVSAKKFFEDGFSSFPNSQVLCVSLINLYLSTGENPDKLFTLLDKAKENDPKNASLYYVEGNIRKDLGQFDEAVAAYRKSIEVDPSYEYGYIGEGLIYTNRADEYAKAANTENDDAKYEKLVEQFNTTLKASIEPFEKAFEVAKATDLKVNIAEQLKQTCYRFCDDPAYKAKYDSYKAFIEANRK